MSDFSFPPIFVVSLVGAVVIHSPTAAASEQKVMLRVVPFKPAEK
jgi:hypothetical protein